MSSDIRDTIPRLQHLVEHMIDQLIGLRAGSTFEQCRLRYSATVDRLVNEGKGRRTASRVGDRDAFWSPTAEVLSEAMRLGFVQKQQLPSARRYVDVHRDRSYVLTESGLAVLGLIEKDLAAFFDELTSAVLAAHPHIRSLIRELAERSLVYPVVSEGMVEAARRDQKSLEYWTEFAINRMDDQGNYDARRVGEAIALAIRRRFGLEAPTSKALSEALSDAFAAVALNARGLAFGATDLSVICQWGMQLRILDQSRYVPDFPDANVIWLAASLTDGQATKLERRGLSGNIGKIADSVVHAYSRFSEGAKSSLSAPYAPIYAIRASAAYEQRVTRALIDMVIERLADGSVPGQTARVQLHLGTTNQPGSEPVFRRGGTRRYEITIHHI
ncbi:MULTISPECIES: hypothetical protein [unclassified Mesorhizobium]|uniref:hypothetical protein n=1 Tax=unclassified Mesorhizobium TaxID=325217 RepID=UPI00333B0898